MKTILFVDEEQYVRNALQRSLRKMRLQWDMHFVSTPDQAARVLVKHPVDVLVTETIFTGHSGLDLLKMARGHYPRIVRIILSGYADRDIIVKTVDLAHQYLAKPCETKTLQATISRAFKVKALLDQDALRNIVSRISALPSLPSLYTALMAEIQSPDPSLDNIAQLISRDPGLMVKILKLVNSSYFALPQPISSPSKATALLGLDLIQAIVLTCTTFDHFKTVRLHDFTLDQMWRHATATAGCAKIIAQNLNLNRETVEAAYMGGLLHDVGKLLIAAYLPDQFTQILACMRERSISMKDAEKDLLGATHAAIGAYLFGLWGLPESIILTTAYHHDPGASLAEAPASIGPLALVHVADALSRGTPREPDDNAWIGEMDYDYLDALGLREQVGDWQELCRLHLSPLP